TVGPTPTGPPLPDLRKIVQGRHIEYHPGKPVDCTGELPDGRPFKNLAELEDMLAAHEEGLGRAFAPRPPPSTPPPPLPARRRGDPRPALPREHDARSRARCRPGTTAPFRR